MSDFGARANAKAMARARRQFKNPLKSIAENKPLYETDLPKAESGTLSEEESSTIGKILYQILPTLNTLISSVLVYNN